MSKVVPQIEFIRRFAKNAGVSQKDIKPVLFDILDEMTRSLSKGYEIKLQGFGTIKRVRFPSKTMPNPSDRSRKMLVLDRYYTRFKPSPVFKKILKANFYPHRYSAPKRFSCDPIDSSTSIDVSQSQSVPIKVRPKIPPARWRAPLSGLVLDLRSQNPNADTRLLRNILRRARESQVDSISISPNDIYYYGEKPERYDISESAYNTALGAIRQALPEAFQRPGSWRLKTYFNDNESPFFNFAALPAAQENWIITFSKPLSARNQLSVINESLPDSTVSSLNNILEKGSGHIAIIGSKPSRRIAQEKIHSMLRKKNIAHQFIVEYHHYEPHQYETMAQSLRHLPKHIKRYPITIFNQLSAADDLHYLRKYPGITICSLPVAGKEDLDNLLRRQSLEPEFFDLVIESILLPASCSECMPHLEPAVRFPHMRRLAAKKGQLLHVHPVRIAKPCSHPTNYHLLNNLYDRNNKEQSLENELYRMTLNHEIYYNTLEKYLE